METRVYNKKINIDESSTHSFWEHKGKENISLRTVLLGSDKTGIAQEKRNNHELELIKSIIGNQKLSILDIGCGIGRWADNLKENIKSYVGIDYTKAFIEYSSHKYKDCENIKFYQMSATDIDFDKVGKDFDLVICSGVLIYINDENLKQFYAQFDKINAKYIYLQESVSIIDNRLTLNKFASKDLNTNYSAIYRTINDYESYINKLHTSIIQSGLLLDDRNGARSETNAYYWILKRS